MKRRIIASKVYGQDAGMLLETFQNAVDQVPLPQGYNWDYKIDEIDNGEMAGQFFIMTDDNQPVLFITFNLAKDGKPIALLNDPTIFDTLVAEVKDCIDELGNLEQYVGNPESRTVSLIQEVTSSTKKVFTPVLCSLADTGLSLKDDEFLFQFIYEWYKAQDEFPSYDEVINEYDDRVSKAVYNDACQRLGASLEHVQYYDSENVEYIELMDDLTWYKINIPDEIIDGFGGEAIWAYYQTKVDWATDVFESKSGTNVYLLGRNGRHVCVRDTVDNVLRYVDLKMLAKQLENSVIYQMENLSDSDLLDFDYWPEDDEYYESAEDFA